MHSEGTARLLKRFRSYIKVSAISSRTRRRKYRTCADEKSDFVLLPCDLAPPKSLKLMSVLDIHRQSPTAVLTSVFYEPVESVKEGTSLLHCRVLADEQLGRNCWLLWTRTLRNCYWSSRSMRMRMMLVYVLPS